MCSVVITIIITIIIIYVCSCCFVTVVVGGDGGDLTNAQLLCNSCSSSGLLGVVCCGFYGSQQDVACLHRVLSGPFSC